MPERTFMEQVELVKAMLLPGFDHDAHDEAGGDGLRGVRGGRGRGAAVEGREQPLVGGAGAEVGMGELTKARAAIVGCSCQRCQDMCKRPCWPTPEEAARLIAAGYGDRLMAEPHLSRRGRFVALVLCPACVGYEMKRGIDRMAGQCCLQLPDGRCELHDLGLKPLEARVAGHWWTEADHKVVNVHALVGQAWASKAGQDLASEWCRLTGANVGYRGAAAQAAAAELDLGPGAGAAMAGVLWRGWS